MDVKKVRVKVILKNEGFYSNGLLQNTCDEPTHAMSEYSDWQFS